MALDLHRRQKRSEPQHLAHQIQLFFQARSQELQALSLLVSGEDGLFRKKKVDMENYSKMMEYVKAVVIYKGKGEITYATDGGAIRLDGRGENSFLGPKGGRTEEKSLLCPWFNLARLCFSSLFSSIKVPSRQTLGN